MTREDLHSSRYRGRVFNNWRKNQLRIEFDAEGEVSRDDVMDALEAGKEGMSGMLASSVEITEVSEMEFEVKCQHEPDWKSVSVQEDGDTAYVDISCMKCGCSGCIGQSETLQADINWE